MRDSSGLVDLFLEAGAEIDARDHRDRTPADWAMLKGHVEMAHYLVSKGAAEPTQEYKAVSKQAGALPEREVPVGEGVLGRMMDPLGQPVDNQGPLSATRTPLRAAVDRPASLVLESGIKGVDLLAPILRGGHVAIDAGSGVGKLVLMTQLARNVVSVHGGRVVLVSLVEQDPIVEFAEWRSMLTDGRLMSSHSALLADADDEESFPRALETGVEIADSFRRDGHDVLLYVESRVALYESALPFLRAHSAYTPEAAVTTMYLTNTSHPGDLERFRGLDGVIRLDWSRADAGLYPAIGPHRSRSRLLDQGLVDTDHRELVERVRGDLCHYYDCNMARFFGRKDAPGFLPPPYHAADRHAAEQFAWRTRRLDVFLTQPFHGTEIWMGEPGETVSLAESLNGCRRILDGEFDEVPEAALTYIGAVDQALEKSRRL